MSTSLGNLVVNLEANIARFSADMSRASQQTEQAMNKINGAVEFGKKALGALGVALSVDLIVGELNKTIGALADLDDMAQKSGASVENLSKLSKVATMVGVDFGEVDGAIVKLAKNLNDVDEKGNKTAKALAAIGISTAEIKNMDAAQVFVLMANKLQGYQDGAGKVAVVTDAISKSAANLLPFMNDAAESIDEFTGYTKEAAAQATKFQDDLGRTRVMYEELKVAILKDALPAMTAFMTAVTDTKRETGLLAKDNSMLTWADDTAIVLSRVVDRAKLVSGALGVVGSSVRAVAAEARVAASLNPVAMAYNKLEGRDPMAEYTKAAAESDKAWAQASAKLDALSSLSATGTEQATIRSIFERKKATANTAGLASLAGMAGINGIRLGEVDYKPGTDKKDPNGKKPEEKWSSAAAADRMVKFALDETFAMRGTIDVTNDLIEADERRMRQLEEKMRAAEQITAGAENIRLSLMTEMEAEQFVHDSKIQQLQAFSALTLENEQQANALIEKETARHMQAKADMENAMQMDKLAMMGNSADQLYSLMEKAGMEQTALAKAVFLTSKAIAVAEIIMNTNVAASKAARQFGAWGEPIAMAIRVAGYASAGMTAGLAIAEASAEGGYDIPAGTNPVTQLHEKEMVLPRAQAEVIRGLAVNGGARGGALTLNYSPQIHIDGDTDMEKNRKMIAVAVQQGNADLVDRLQRAGRI